MSSFQSALFFVRFPVIDKYVAKLLLICTGLMAGACEQVSESCVENDAFFREQVEIQVLEPVCMACHVASGSARESSLILSTIVVPNYLEVNNASISDMAGLERDGVSLLLSKPLGKENHGGGAVLTEDSSQYAILQEYVERLKNPVVCEAGPEDIKPEELGLVLASPAATLRQASIQLAGRLPSPDESELVFDYGEDGLSDALKLVMEDPKFIDIMKEEWNNILLTDKYFPCCNAIGLVDYDRFYNLYWYEGTSDRNTKRAYLNEAIAREPIELIGHIIAENKPFTEILTANYTMVNAYSATSYGLSYGELPDVTDPESQTFYPATLEAIPHAGILTTPAYLNRFPTTATNRNRHRSWAFYKNFLATDILQMADRPIDLTGSEVHNPTLNDPQCNICHAVMEPVAGLFQNWDDDGALNPREEGWYPEMFTPGFANVELPPESKDRALQWLGEVATNDSRFQLAITRQAFVSLTGLPIINPAEAQLDPVLKEAWLLQSNFLDKTAEHFVDSGYNYRELLKSILLSHFYRAIDDAGASEATLKFAGKARLLSPEHLNRKIHATTGLPWRKSANSTDHLTDRYKMLYGGIDSNSVTERLIAPNGIIANIGLRMATEVACVAVTNDFVISKNQRRMFPWVEPGYQPVTPEGLPVPEAEERIRKNMQYLHYRFTGEQWDINDEELTKLYQLWYDTWQEGRLRVAAEEESTSLHYMCDVHHEYWTGTLLPAEQRLYADHNYTIRAWMAVLTYELSDYRFLFE